jgi:small-conductance mechanosensitive channel
VIAPADIPARADADEEFLQAVVRRAQTPGAGRAAEQELDRHSAAVQRLGDQYGGSDLSALPVRRLGNLLRHWRLHERALSRWRDDLQRATASSSLDAVGLASRSAQWEATRLTAAGSAPALRQRMDALIAEFDQAEQVLSAPLSRMLDLGRKGNALSAQIESRLAAVQDRVAEQDRRLLKLDAPPLWEVQPDAARGETPGVALRNALDIERAFAGDYDAVHIKRTRVFVACLVLLFALMLWLRYRAGVLVAAGKATTASLYALFRPLAGWLVLGALGWVLLNVQGPLIRQQVVMALAWVPVLRLLPPRVRNVVGPWAYLSAAFYLLNVVTSLLAGNQFWYRVALLALDLLMLLTLGWLIFRTREEAPGVEQSWWLRAIRLLLVVAAAALLVAAGSNVLGNFSFAAMITSAVLDSSYAALVICAGATVLVACGRVVLLRPTVSRLIETTRPAGALIAAGARVGGILMVGAWLVAALNAFRIYRPVVDALGSVLSHDFTVGKLSISLGSIVAFSAAAWLAFWLARTIRTLLAEDILPRLSLPRGVDNSISTLSYYTILFLGLLAALAVAGFEVGQLAIVFGALSVGIGFGLQDIVKNFVSGLILMVERPVQPGDVVDVAGMSGRVREIGMRATIVTTFEGAEVVVPNGMLLADKLVNWTLSGTRRRIEVIFQTDHDVDPKRTIEVLLGVAATVEGLAPTPAPVAILTGLAPGGLEFKLMAWTTGHIEWVIVRSELAAKVREGLAKAGIEVPPPQYDLHLRSVSREAAEELARVRPPNA